MDSVKRTVNLKIVGYAFAMRIEGVSVVWLIQARDKETAISKVLEMGHQNINRAHVNPVTMIPGHQDDLFPAAVEIDLDSVPLISEIN